MDIGAVAAEMLDVAVARGQSVLRTDDSTPLPELRAEVRRVARDRGVRVRTGMYGDVLAVVRADAALWDETTAVMRQRLTAPDEPNVVA